MLESDKENQMGLPKGMDILNHLRPKMWFSAHHHINFDCLVGETWFHALSKPPKRNWYATFEIEGEMSPLKYRGEWISILRATGEIMRNPGILKERCWNELWKEIGELERIEDYDVLPLNTDLMAYTAAFCSKFGVYCPNAEIRAYMSSRT